MSRSKLIGRGLALLCLLLPCLLVGLVRFFWMLATGDEVSGKRALRGLDMAANASALAGNPFETMSSHCGRVQSTWWARGIIWVTDKVDQPGHCLGANLQERPLLDLIEAYRTRPGA
jgi:hypothetical protein